MEAYRKAQSFGDVSPEAEVARKAETEALLEADLAAREVHLDLDFGSFAS